MAQNGGGELEVPRGDVTAPTVGLVHCLGGLTGAGRIAKEDGTDVDADDGKAVTAFSRPQGTLW